MLTSCGLSQKDYELGKDIDYETYTKVYQENRQDTAVINYQ